MMHENIPILHFLAGKICSGKSTLATDLAHETMSVLIAEDEWLATLFGDDMNELGDYVRYSARLRAIMAPHLITLLQSGLNVVLDFPANTPEMRSWMGGIIETANCRHQLHYLVSSDEDCKERLRKRNAEGDHPFSATDEQFDRVNSFFVPPAPEEGFHIILHSLAPKQDQTLCE